MSKTIDEKVVEMRFDNSNFEKNAKQTMSTLDKFKEKLNFSGATKGIESVQNNVNKFNTNSMTNSIEKVQASFSKMEVIGNTVLANLTNSAVNMGKSFAKSLLFSTKSEGWGEYELTMNAVKTLQNSTGKSVDEINKKLKTLDDYADETVYSTADMFNNIYKFTNAGIDLDTATTAMIGIANATALAGQGAQQASIAYYNLAQSIGMGYLTTIDYKSINLANIATKEFKKQMADTAVELGTIKKVGEDAYSVGKDVYSLQSLFSEGLKDQWATTDVMMKVFTDYGSKETEIGKRAWIAAQSVNTFSDMMAALKAEAGTGWKETWQILFGSLDEAKAFWTTIYTVISNISSSLSKFRNNLLDSAFSRTFSNIIDNAKNAMQPIEQVTEAITDTTSAISKTLEDYNQVVNQIINGNWGNGQKRWDKLTEAGYDWAKAQNMVNERLGSSVRHAEQLGEAQEELVESTIELKDETGKIISKGEYFNKYIAKASDEELRLKGYTDDQIESFRELTKVSKKLGVSIDDLFEKGDQINGRWLIRDALQNIGDTIRKVFGSIGQAFSEVFGGKISNAIFDAIAAFHRFSNAIKITDETASKIKDTFKGLFSLIDIALKVIITPIKLAVSLLGKLFGVVHIGTGSILDLTAAVGRAITWFHNWIEETFSLSYVVKILSPIVERLGKALRSIILFVGPKILKGFEYIKDITIELYPYIKNFFVNIVKHIIEAINATIRWIQNNEHLISIMEKIKNVFSNVGNGISGWIKGLKETDNIAKYIFEGLINGIKENALKVWDLIKDVALGIIQTIKDVLLIRSPSKVMFAIGGFIIAGLIAGMKDKQITVINVLKTLATKIIETFKVLSFGNIIAVGFGAGIIYLMKRILDLLNIISSPIKALTNILNGLGYAISDFGLAAKNFGKSKKYEAIASIIKNITMAIGVLVGALVILGKLPKEQLKQGAIALGAIGAALAAFVVLLAFLSNKLSDVKLPDVGKILAAVLGISVGMLIMAKALKDVAKIDPDNITSAIFGLIACAAAMLILIVALSKVTKSLKGTKNIEKMAKVFIGMSLGMLIIAKALRKMSKVKWGDIGKMAAVIIGLVGIFAAIALLNKYTKNSITKSSETIKSVGTALLLLVIAMKLAGGLKAQDFKNGLKVIGIFSSLLVAMLLISKKFKGTDMIKVSGSILMVTIAVGMLAFITRLMGSMDGEKMKKGLICVGILSSFVAALILVSKQSASFHGTTLIGVGLTIAAMGLLVFLLGQLDPEKAKNGLKAIGVISMFMAALIKVSKNFNPGNNAMKVLIALTVMISLLSVALIGLSFLDQEKLSSTTKALSSILISLAAVIASTSKLKIEKGVFKSLFSITLIIGMLAAIIVLISRLTDLQGAINASKALSLLLISCGGIAAALSKFDLDVKKAGKGALALTTMFLPLLAFVGILKIMDAINLETSMSNVLALTIITGAMTGLLYVLSKIGDSKFSNIAKGVFGLTLMFVPLVAFVGILALMQNVERAMENVKALIVLASACTLLLIPLMAIGAIMTTGVGALAVVSGILALSLMIVPLVAFVAVLALMQNVNNATQNVELLTNMMEKLTECLVKLSLVAPLALMADAAIFGLIGAMMAIGSLATIIGALVDKFPQLQTFLDKGLPILEQLALGIGKILGNILAGLMSSVANELPHIGQKLSEFALYALPFITTMSNMDDRVINGVKTLASSLLILTGANLLDTIATFINGGKSFSRLGTELSEFAINALPFLLTLSLVDSSVLEGSKALAGAILSLTAANFLDSIVGWLKGESDLASFGAKLKPLGEGLRSFVDGLGTFSQEQVDTVQAGCDALKTIAEAAGQIPKHGGLKQAFTGDNDISTFADKLGSTGTGILNFVKELTKEGAFDKSKIEIVKSGCDALKAIAEAAGQIPKYGGIKQAFTGDNDISTFADKLGNVAAGIRGFVWELQKDDVINESSIEKINIVNNLMYAISDLGRISIQDSGKKLEEFASRLTSFANRLNEFVGSMNLISNDNLSLTIDKISKIKEIAEQASQIDSNSIENLGKSLKNLGKEGVDNFQESISGDKAINKIKQAVNDLINAVITSAGSMIDIIKSKFNEVGSNAYEGLNYDQGRGNWRYFSFESLGRNFVEGFAAGIKNNISLAIKAGSLLGNGALQGIQESTDTHSPSREAHKLGTFFDLGFINGIKSLSNSVYNESSSLGDQARDGLSNAIDRVSSIIDGGISDDIVISPILDLSDVESGANRIGSLLSGQNYALSSNLGAIASNVNYRNQNRVNNSDVLSAINRLSDNLGNVRGDTYNVNGITYDDGSNITQAVQTLIRAAKVERRT